VTEDHLELLRRCGCDQVTLLFDGDAAGAAAPANAALAILKSGLDGKVALLPRSGAKSDPHDFATAHGKSGLEPVLAAAVPLTEYLIDGAIRIRCGIPSATQASVEQKLRMVRALIPYVLACGEDQELRRSALEKRIARRLDLGLGALKNEVQRHDPGQRQPAQPHVVGAHHGA